LSGTVREVARAQRAHEELGLADLARGVIDDRQGQARVVDEGLLARPVFLPQYGIERALPGTIARHEMGGQIQPKWVGSLGRNTHLPLRSGRTAG
jgi:hypothetical protein